MLLRTQDVGVSLVIFAFADTPGQLLASICWAEAPHKIANNSDMIEVPPVPSQP